MRLTCPNCGAQYEVPDDVIPKDGRDVQCSNCGTTWFQPHPDAVVHDERLPDPSELRSAIQDDIEEPASEPDPEPDLPDQGPTAAEPESRGLSPDVTDILQEEAEHEARLRAEDAHGLETQPDLGLDDTTDDAERRAREARARMERLKGPQEEDTDIEEAVAAATAAAAAASTSRRDRLPDIDEINSSLRPNAPGASDEMIDDLEDEPKRGGFARGFAIPLVILAILVLVYINAPRIATAVPQLEPALASYVSMVDQFRVWLNSQIDAFMP